MEENRKSKSKKIINTVTLIILLIILYFAYQYYQMNNFNEFIRSEANLHTSKFRRDSETKYSEKRSYKIESPEYNDAMFYKKVKVQKNQAYKVTCMVKTEGVESKVENAGGVGARNFYRRKYRKVSNNFRNTRLAKNRTNF